MLIYLLFPSDVPTVSAPAHAQEYAIEHEEEPLSIRPPASDREDDPGNSPLFI
jgi:hypothetical protein